MSSISQLDTLSLRQLYYILSIDLYSMLASGIAADSDDASTRISQSLCSIALDNFGLVLEQDEIRSLFVEPLMSQLQLASVLSDSSSNGVYALSFYHLQFISSFELFISGVSK